MIQKYKYILGIALVAVVSFFSIVSTTYANDITFSPAGGGNRYNGIDSITSGSGAPQRYSPVAGGIFECADWEEGRSICRKEYLDNNQTGRNVLVYGDCDNTGSSPRYDCTEITNVPNQYTSVDASRTVPREVIASALGETAEESSETLNFEDGYTITVDNDEYQGECAEFTRDGEPGIACKAEGITGTLDDCFKQDGGGDRDVVCRSTRVLGDPETVGDLANSEPIASESQATGVEEANQRATGGSSTPASQVSYESFTSFPGVGRISNICQLTQALWYLGFAILFTAAFGMFIYAGFLYTSSGVNAAQVNQAKGMFTNTIIGVILGLSVFIILNIINPGLLTANCEIAAVTGSGSTQTNSGGGTVEDALVGSRTCNTIDPSVWKFQGGKNMSGVDERLQGVATTIFQECSQFGEFQISSTVRTCCGTSFHITGDALDFADGSGNIRDKETGRCIERTAAECGISPSRINPGVDANQRFHVHIDLGTRN